MTFKPEHMETIRDAMNSFAGTIRGEVEKKKTMYVDTVLQASEYTSKALETVEKLAPFGEGNREPLFLIPHAEVISVTKVGKT